MLRLARAGPLVVACLALAMVANPAAATPTPAFKVFISKQGHYRLTYPASWHAQKVSLGSSNSHFVAPNRASVSILTMGAGFASVDALAAAMEKQAKANHAWTITGKSKTRVAGSDGRIITAHVTQSQNRSAVVAYVAFLGRGQAWVMIYSALPSQHIRTWRDFQKIVSSFTFTK